MKSKLLLLCFLVVICTACAAESENLIKIDIMKSGDEVYINPEITLMLYRDSEWKSFTYSTDLDSEITSTDKEISGLLMPKKYPMVLITALRSG